VPYRPVLGSKKVTYVSTYGPVAGVRRTIRRIYAYQLRTAYACQYTCYICRFSAKARKYAYKRTLLFDVYIYVYACAHQLTIMVLTIRYCDHHNVLQEQRGADTRRHNLRSCSPLWRQQSHPLAKVCSTCACHMTCYPGWHQTNTSSANVLLQRCSILSLDVAKRIA
jgi:hypothetical protein